MKIFRVDFKIVTYWHTSSQHVLTGYFSATLFTYFRWLILGNNNKGRLKKPWRIFSVESKQNALERTKLNLKVHLSLIGPDTVNIFFLGNTHSYRLYMYIQSCVPQVAFYDGYIYTEDLFHEFSKCETNW